MVNLPQWVSNGGGITVFGNTHNWGTWTQYGVVYETRVTRRDIHFADFDGKHLPPPPSDISEY